MAQEIKSKEFSYHLPEQSIALYPLAQRDESKLLVLNRGKISHHHFYDLPDLLPTNSSLFFNDTKVIPARMLFRKDTGAVIEVFLLQPSDKSQPVQLAMQSKATVQWKCAIGNLKRWKKGTAIQIHHNEIKLQATLTDIHACLVDFNWEPKQLSFGEVVNKIGNTPLPPYLHRQEEDEDKTRYQTVYSHYEGAVAAPTAGLHFTDKIIAEVKSRKVITDFLTLHVSAGTFQPIKTENALDHTMHAEQVIVTRQNLETLLEPDRKIIAVGTTSMRTLESLYWFGVKILNNGEQRFLVEQTDPHQLNGQALPSRNDALQAALGVMDPTKPLIGQTSIYITPGYKFRICEGLVTNFHQPGSTLLLLVAAFVGSGWKAVYQQALDEKYRFLSYGDSSLLLPEWKQ